MINTTDYLSQIQNSTSIDQIIDFSSKQLFLPSIISYWLFQFIITLIIGLALVRENRSNFWAIFILTQVVGLVILTFIFIVPFFPQLLSKIGF